MLNEASATPDASLLSAPTNPAATAGDTQVSLSWTASSNADTYNIYRVASDGSRHQGPAD